MFTCLFQSGGHDVRAVVDSQHYVGNTCRGQSLDLVEDHRFVGEFDQWLRQSKGLYRGQAYMCGTY